MRTYLFIVMTLAMSVFSAYAQNALRRPGIVSTGTDTPIHNMESQFVNLDQIVVTGTGTHRSLGNSPIPVQVITAEELQKTGVTSLEEALVKLAPNITTTTNGMGTFLNLNGIGQDYLLVLENGHRINGDDRYARININNVKRIEIQNGAASALYGSEAIGGVIQIITDDPEHTISVTSGTHLTSKDRFTESLHADIGIGKISSYTSYRREEAGNWQVNDIDEEGNKTGRPMSAGFLTSSYGQRMSFSPDDRITVSVRGDLLDYETRRPESATYFKKGAKQDDGSYAWQETRAYSYNMAHQSYMYGIGAIYKIRPTFYLDADIYADHYTSSYKYFVKSGSFMPGDKQKRKETHYYNGHLKGIFKPGDHHQMSVGLEYVRDQLRSESDNIRFESMFTGSLFAQDEISFSDRLQGVVGVRYIYNELFEHHLAPTVSLMYKPSKWIRLRTTYASGFKSPTLSQLYATDQTKTASRYTVGNTDLKPEISESWSFNAEYSSPRVSCAVTGLFNHVDDMINYRTLTDAQITALGYAALSDEYATIRQRSNIDKARIATLQVNTNLYFGGGWVAGGGYVLTDSEARTYGTDGSGNATVTCSPVDKSVKQAAICHLTWDRSWNNYQLHIRLDGQIQGERYSETYGYAPGYQLWSLTMRHTFTFDHATIEPGIGIDNLFNERDTRPWNSNFSTVNPGRALFVNLIIKCMK